MESSSAKDPTRVEAREEDSTSFADDDQRPDVPPSSPKPVAITEEAPALDDPKISSQENPQSPKILSTNLTDFPTDFPTIESAPQNVLQPPRDPAHCQKSSEQFSPPPENHDETSQIHSEIISSSNANIQNREIDNFDDDILFSHDRHRPTFSGESTPTRKRAGTDFLPINAEIKRIGVEISEEHAKQLKNDVRRLSPILVSLRERTLGEISLNSDSGLFEDENRIPKIETNDEDSISNDESSPKKITDLIRDSTTFSSIEKFDAIADCRRNLYEDSYKTEKSATNRCNTDDPEVRDNPEIAKIPDFKRANDVNDAENSKSFDEETKNDPSTISCGISSPAENSNAHRELVIVLSRVDDESANDAKSKQITTEETKIFKSRENVADFLPIADRTIDDSTTKIGEKSTIARSCNVATIDEHSGEIVCSENDALVTIGDYCVSPKYLNNDQLTRKSPKVVIKRTLQKLFVETSSPKKNFVESTSLENLRTTKIRVDDSIETTENRLEDKREGEISFVNEDSLTLESSRTIGEIANEPRNSIYGENETETGSDTSELNSVTSGRSNDRLEVTNVASSGNDNDSHEVDRVSSEIITRLEAERPEAFTEDSAESLALATGARDEVRSDGSDSGLGSEIPGDPGPAPAPESDSETSFLDRIPDDILTDKEKAVNPLEAYETDAGTSETESQKQQQQSLSLTIFPTPPKSSLKRRLTDCMEGEPSPKRINTEDSARKKRNIQFDAVTVYYFPRSQGFTCVPSQGGSTLGMSATHTHAERFSLAEHATEQRRIHRARLAQLRSERAANCVTEAASSSEDPSDDTDEEPSDTEELDIDSYYFLQPVPTWQRRALLRAAGVRRIDAVEKDDCRDIRASREHCGCGCKGYCDPESCPCSRANVKCQVDRAGFPCGCSRDGCANSSGRIEFNPVRVRTHFIHTLMRLQLEKKQRDEDRTDHESLIQNQPGRGPMRELPTIMTNNLLNPMSEHSNAIAIDQNSCLTTGGFTTLHYDSTETNSSSLCQNLVHGGREDSLDLYAIRDDCYNPDNDSIDVDQSQNSQRKIHPEFGQTFQTFPNQQSNVNFSQNVYQDYQSYQNIPTTSRTQFQPQFQNIGPTNVGFSHYAYVQDPNVATNSCQSHTAHTLHQNIYDNTFTHDDNTTIQQQYTNLNSVQPMNAVVQQMGKLEPFSELLAGRYSYYGDVEPQPLGGYQSPNCGSKIEPEKIPNVGQNDEIGDGEDCDENFGEIIKKSMVETVSA